MSTFPHHDDYTAPRQPDVTIRLGHDWTYEAVNDGTLRLTAKKSGMVVELGTNTAEAWFDFLAEVAKAGAAHAALDAYAQRVAVRAVGGFDVFGMFAKAQQDAERIG